MRGGTPSTEDFGQRLRLLRARAGLSQEALSHAAGVSVRALADMERGRTRGPQRRTVQALAEALGLDEDEAAGLEEAAALGRPRLPLRARPPGRPGVRRRRAGSGPRQRGRAPAGLGTRLRRRGTPAAGPVGRGTHATA
ncbi:helix-turn-helix transcriptional regulator [Streptomyces sp. NPDC058145]|uniref:helix-turn-helix transcriptional regulator n=1 Tax=Streptomyces sp. NPDC058145 TaxID=3346356 RepID=UPI0036E80C82